MKHKLLHGTMIFSSMVGWFGCSEPFAVDRHDLLDARILGVRLQDSRLEVQVWNGQSMYHQDVPTIEWLNQVGSAVGTGVDFVMEDMENRSTRPTSVRYLDPDGEFHEALFDLEDGGDADDGGLVLTPSLYTLSSTTDFALSARQAQNGEPSTSDIASDGMRIVMSVKNDEGAEVTTVTSGKMRWMTVGGKGTFLERSALETDFYRADILMDRDELLENNPLDIETATIFALYVDGVGGNQWTWMDLWYTDVVRFHHENRWLEVSELPVDWDAGSPLSVELRWDDAAQVMRLLSPSVEVEDVVIPVCSSVTSNDSNRFQWSWLELGRCTISDVNGTRIVLETR
jgi:hypothetical protein